MNKMIDSNSFFEPEEKKHYNSRIIDAYIKLIDAEYPHINKDELLSHAGLESYQVADQGCWFTQKNVDMFYEKLIQMTGNRNIARDAGRFFSSFQEGNLIKKYFLTVLGPMGAYEKMVQVSRNFTNHTEYVVRKLTENSVEVSFFVKGGVEEKPYQCENRIGILEALTLIYSLKPPYIEHPECMFNNGRICRYIVTWENSSILKLKKIRNLILTGSVIINSALFFLFPLVTLSYILPASVIGALLFVLSLKYKEVRALVKRLESSEKTTDELIRQIDINFNTTLITHEVGQMVNHKMKLDEILKGALKVIQQRMEFDRGLILLADSEKEHLIFRDGFGYNDIHREVLETNRFHLDNPNSRGVFVVCYREKRPFLVNNMEDIKNDLSLRSLQFARSMGSKSFICCPIVCDDEALGILSVDNLYSRRPLIQSDISLLMGVASAVATGIKKVQLLESRELQFRSIIEVLASSIDARDPLTAGHSKQVTEYSDAICKGLGLSHEASEVIRIASLLHDYGKIGVPDNILKKNGRLSQEEYSIIKTHALKTRDILSRINFEGSFAEIPDIAGSHHEKMDGSGYPLGLKGNQIPLGARIIAAADFFEAITAKRHYRNPMSLMDALETVMSETGAHLDPVIVKIFFDYLTEKYSLDKDAVMQRFNLIQMLPLQSTSGV